MRIRSDELRCVAEIDELVVGRAQATHNPWQFHPRKYHLTLEVDAAHRRRGIGGTLLRRMVELLRARDALLVRVVASENDAAAVPFLTRRGFREVWREIPSELDLTRFDVAPFADRAAPPGVAISTLADELARDPAVLRELYKLSTLTNLGQQELDPLTPPPFEEWVTGQIEGPQSIPEACFLARVEGTLVGISSLERLPKQADALEPGYTSVHRDYRRRGIAFALKLRTLAYAKACGYRALKTHSNAINTGMLTLNTELGFRPGPALVTFERRLD